MNGPPATGRGRGLFLPIDAGAFAAIAILVLAGCVPERGGWDVDALATSAPELAGTAADRLGDMLPFPSLDARLAGEAIALVACRFPGSRPVRLRGSGPGWPAEWARAAVEAVDRRVPGVELVLVDDAAEEVDIEIQSVGEDEGAAPAGLGDTLSECDVSAAGGSDSGVRGRLTHAQIRMRRVRPDLLGRMQPARAEEWVGALMHELGHALGFNGHAATGDSIVVVDESRLRRAGRRALEGRGDVDATLAALYRLKPGRVLGVRPARGGASVWIEALRANDRRQRESGIARVATLASTGDREARIVWRYADGSQWVIRFPDWASELRSGADLSAVPDRATRSLIRAQTGRTGSALE